MTITPIAAFLATLAPPAVRFGGGPRRPRRGRDGILLLWYLAFAGFVAVITVATGRV